MNVQVYGIDPRCLSAEKLTPPAPLPFVSRRALKGVKSRIDPPTVCDCCGDDHVRLVVNSEIYRGVEYGDWPYAYLCDACGAYVGLHPSTDLPLGTMADSPTREARKSVKKPFVALANHRFKGDRDQAYAWLAKDMGTDRQHCHFAMFDIEQCEQAKGLIRDKLAANKERL